MECSAPSLQLTDPCFYLSERVMLLTTSFVVLSASPHSKYEFSSRLSVCHSLVRFSFFAHQDLDRWHLYCLSCQHFDFTKQTRVRCRDSPIHQQWHLHHHQQHHQSLLHPHGVIILMLSGRLFLRLSLNFLPLLPLLFVFTHTRSRDRWLHFMTTSFWWHW